VQLPERKARAFVERAADRLDQLSYRFHIRLVVVTIHAVSERRVSATHVCSAANRSVARNPLATASSNAERFGGSLLP
jgi:hypothetical protein